MADLKYIHHSAFLIKNDDKALLIDPWVDRNEKFNWRNEPITDIFLTHCHGDHLGNAVEIAKEKNAPITAIFETAKYLENEHNVSTRPVGLGSWIDYSWGRALFYPAFHSNSLPNGEYAGVAASIIIDIDGVRIFHAGDTCLTGEMKIIKELYAPHIAILPIGGNYTMDVEHAVMAARWLGVQTVVPMHYGTFPEINADLERFAKLIAAGNTTCQILDPSSDGE